MDNFPTHELTTISDVAKRSGVSIATVSRVINKKARVNAETAARVQQAIDELDYIPQAAARNLAIRKTNTIGLLLPGVGTDFFFPILRGIEAAVRQAGFNLLIAIQPEETDKLPTKASSTLGNHNTDGLLVFGSLAGDDMLARFTQKNFPVVLLYHSAPEGSGITSIMIENRNGTRKIVEHLIKVHGHKRIGFLRGPKGHQDSTWREKGYYQALTEHGLEHDPRLVASGEFSEKGGQAAVEAWLKGGIKMDAIFAGDDETAIGVITGLNTMGLHVPKDIAVVGFDDILAARYLNPPLTTVRAPTEQVGFEAVRQLVRRIRGEQADLVILLPTELVIRQSCGCNRGEILR